MKTSSLVRRHPLWLPLWLLVFSPANILSSPAANLPPTVAKALPLVFANEMSGVISLPGQQDRFTFIGTAGQRLFFDTLDLDGESLTIRLLAPNGNAVWETGANGDWGPFYLTAAGTYTLRVFSYGDSTGDYRFRVLDMANATALSLGATVPGQLSPQAETDAYHFSGTTGQHLNLQSLLASSMHASWNVIAPDGRVLAGNNIASDIGQVVLSASGTYLVIVQGSLEGANPLDYQIRASVVSNPTGSPSGFGTVHSGTIAAGETKSFAYTAPAGTLVYFDSLDETGSSLIADFRTGDGTLLFSVYTSSDHGPVLVPASGNHTLDIRGADEFSTGSYSLRLLNLAADATALTYGSTYSGSVNPGYQTIPYRFTGAVGQRVYLDILNATAGAVQAQLVAPSGSAVWSSWWAGGDLGPALLTEPGLHHLFVKSSSATPADYQLRLIEITQPPAAVLAFNTTRTGTLNDALQADVFRFDATAGQRLFFDGQGSSAEGGWALIRPDDQSAGGNNLTMDFEVALPQTGTYALILASSSLAPVPYQFRVVSPTATSSPLTLGAATTGTIAVAGEEHRFTFTGGAGQRLYYDAQDTDYDNIDARLLGPDGALVMGSWNSDYDSGPLTLTEAGQFTLVIGGGTEAVGDFGFRLIDLGQPPASVLSLNTLVTGTLDPAHEMDIFRFDGTAGQRLFFDSRNVTADGTWTLYDINNNPLTSGSLSGDFVVTLPQSASYVLVLATSSSTPVLYSFNIRTPDSPSSALTLGNLIQGTLANPGEQHRFTFAGTVGMHLYCDAQDSDFDNINLQLLDPAGNGIVAGNADSDFGPFTLGQSGTYTVVVGGASDTLGDYRFRLLDLASASVLGATASGVLDPANATDAYRLAGLAGQRILLERLSASGSEANWRLVDLFDQSLASGSISGNLPEAVLPVDGTYYVLVEGHSISPTPLNYQIRQSVTNPTGSPSGFGAVHTGAIGPGDQQVYPYSGPAGLLAYFDSQDNTYYPLMVELRDPTDEVVFSINPSADAGPWVLPKSGAYTLTVMGADGSSTGDYRFRLLNLATDSTSLTLGTSVAQSLDAPFKTQFYRFAGTPGQQLYYDSLNNQSLNNLSLLVFGPSGRYLLGSGSYWAHSDAGPIPLTDLGTYYLAFASGQADPADSAFRLIDVAQPPAASVALGEARSATLDPGFQTQIYRLAINGQRRLFVHGSGSDVRASWRLYSPDLQWAAGGTAVGDAEFGLPPRDGSYLLVVSGDSFDPVPFTLELRSPTSAVQALALGTPVTQTLAGPGDERRLTFSGIAGQTLYYDALEDDADAVSASLISPSGRILFNQNSVTDVGPFTLTESGVYELVQDSTLFAPTDYSFRLLDAALQPSLALDTRVSGTLSLGYQAHLLLLEPRVGLRHFFNSLGVDGGASWSFYSPDSGALAGNSINADFEATPVQAGSHVLVLSSSSLTPVPFSFEVIPGNHPPVLNLIGDRVVDEETSLNFTAAATDPESPNDVLTFSLDPGAPAGATLNPVTGAFAWTPTEVQGPADYAVTVRVTDDGLPPLSDAETFTIRVNEVNRSPLLVDPPDTTLNEMVLWTHQLSASDADQPANTLTFSKVSGPANLIVSPAGAVSWTPSEAEGPGTHPVTVRVTDSGSPALSADQIFTLTVAEVNLRPTLVDPPDTNINEMVAWTYQLGASDADQPANTLTFSKVSGPANLIVSPAGAVSWTPSEAEGPGTHPVTVRVTDSGSPALSADQIFTLTVAEVNLAPTLAAISSQTIHAGATSTPQVSASDADLPTNALSFSLVTAPTGANIDPSTGAFRWTATPADAGTVKPVTIQVSDNGTPARTATTSFNITVVAPIRVDVASVSLGSVTLRWSAIEGQRYRVEYQDHLGQPAWTDVPGDVTATGTSATKVDDTLGALRERYYRIRTLP